MNWSHTYEPRSSGWRRMESMPGCNEQIITLRLVWIYFCPLQYSHLITVECGLLKLHQPYTGQVVKLYHCGNVLTFDRGHYPCFVMACSRDEFHCFIHHRNWWANYYVIESASLQHMQWCYEMFVTEWLWPQKHVQSSVNLISAKAILYTWHSRSSDLGKIVLGVNVWQLNMHNIMIKWKVTHVSGEWQPSCSYICLHGFIWECESHTSSLKSAEYTENSASFMKFAN